MQDLSSPGMYSYVGLSLAKTSFWFIGATLSFVLHLAVESIHRKDMAEVRMRLPVGSTTALMGISSWADSRPKTSIN